MLKHGNTLIKEVYHGSTKIGKIYHGSTLVYQSIPKLRLYGWRNSSYPNLKIFTNKIDTINGNFVIFDLGEYLTSYRGMVTGNLGEVNSQANFLYYQQSMTANYAKTATINGVKIHLYNSTGQYSLITSLAVLDNSEIGARVMNGVVVGWGEEHPYPYAVDSISSSSVSYTVYDGSSTSVPRDSTLDFIWTTEAIS